jgi:hypothetical protein
LHQEALVRARNYRKSESGLLEILVEIESSRAFEKLGYSSLFVYCTMALGLSESHSYSLISVARKSREVPELKTLTTSTTSKTCRRAEFSYLDRPRRVRYAANLGGHKL